MDRPIEPQTPFREMQIQTRMVDQVGSPRVWVPPVPLRVRWTGFRSLGLLAPNRPSTNQVSTLRVDGFCSLRTYAGQRHWLVVTAPLAPTTEPVGVDDAETTVDGGPCRTTYTLSKTGFVYMAYTDLSRPVLARMAASVAERTPRSNILARLLPRYAVGAVRWFPAANGVEFWAAI
jgi:hypothetical protein